MDNLATYSSDTTPITKEYLWKKCHQKKDGTPIKLVVGETIVSSQPSNLDTIRIPFYILEIFYSMIIFFNLATYIVNIHEISHPLKHSLFMWIRE